MFKVNLLGPPMSVDERSGTNSGSLLEKTTVKNIKWKTVNLSNSRFVDTTFKNGKIEDTFLGGTHLENVVFDNIRVDGLDLSYCKILNLTFKNCNLQTIHMNHGKFERIVFENTIAQLILIEYLQGGKYFNFEIKKISNFGFFSITKSLEGFEIIIKGTKSIDFKVFGMKGTVLKAQGCPESRIQVEGYLGLLEVDCPEVTLGIFGKIDDVNIKSSTAKNIYVHCAKIDNMIIENSFNSHDLMFDEATIKRLSFKDCKYEDIRFIESKFDLIEIDSLDVDELILNSEIKLFTFDFLNIAKSLIMNDTHIISMHDRRSNYGKVLQDDMGTSLIGSLQTYDHGNNLVDTQLGLTGRKLYDFIKVR